jgi:hypothetical protein
MQNDGESKTKYEKPKKKWKAFSKILDYYIIHFKQLRAKFNPGAIKSGSTQPVAACSQRPAL